MARFARTTLSSNTLASIQEEHLPLLAPPIRVCVEVIRAQMERAPVSIVSPDSSAAADYEALAETLLPARERTARTKTPGRKVVQLCRQQPK